MVNYDIVIRHPGLSLRYPGFSFVIPDLIRDLIKNDPDDNI